MQRKCARRERQTDRDRPDRERETDRQTDKTERQAQTDSDKQTETGKQRQTEAVRQRQTERNPPTQRLRCNRRHRCLTPTRLKFIHARFMLWKKSRAWVLRVLERDTRCLSNSTVFIREDSDLREGGEMMMMM